MGTNYYLVRDEKLPCPHCCRPYPVERLHIGKSSGGWVFLLCLNEEHGLRTLDAWRARWSLPDWRIENEYSDPITSEQMERIILDRNRADGKPLRLQSDYDPENCSPGGPTWEMVKGAFS